MPAKYLNKSPNNTREQLTFVPLLKYGHSQLDGILQIISETSIFSIIMLDTSLAIFYGISIVIIHDWTDIMLHF